MKNFFKKMTVLLGLLAALSFMLTLTACLDGWVEIYIANESTSDIRAAIVYLEYNDDPNSAGTPTTVFDETVKAGEIGNYSAAGLSSVKNQYKITVTQGSTNYYYPDRLGLLWADISEEFILIFDGDNLRKGSKSDL